MQESSLQLSIESKVDRIAFIDSVVRKVAIEMGFSEDDAQDIELAAHEAVVNAIRHGAPIGGDASDPPPLVDVRIAVEHELDVPVLIIEIRDRGAGFAPEAVPSPLHGEGLLRPTGRGLYLMRRLMDDVTYSAHPEGGTVVRLRKRRHLS